MAPRVRSENEPKFFTSTNTFRLFSVSSKQGALAIHSSISVRGSSQSFVKCQIDSQLSGPVPGNFKEEEEEEESIIFTGSVRIHL